MADKFTRFPSSSSTGASHNSTLAFSTPQPTNKLQSNGITGKSKEDDEKLKKAMDDAFKEKPLNPNPPPKTPAADYGPGVAGTPDAAYFIAKGMDPAQAAMLAYSALSAAQASATQAALSTIGQMAATAAAALKLSNDLNDATVSFMKNIGSSVKAAAQ